MMKLFNKIFFLFAVFATFFSCNQPQQKQKFSWLEGKWTQTNGEANFHEEWTRINDTLLAGKGFVVEEADTLFSEKLTLLTEGSKTVYRVEMVTGRIADFKLTEETEDRLVFELPENDFPSKIIYTQQPNNELMVVLIGTDNGKEMRDELIFIKQH